jgi:hypothetical protein
MDNLLPLVAAVVEEWAVKEGRNGNLSEKKE